MSRATLSLAVLVGVAPLLCLPGFYDAANLPQSAWIVVAGWLWLGGVLISSGLLAARPPTSLLLALLWSGLTLGWTAWRAEGWPQWLLWLSCAAVGLGARSSWRGPGDAWPVLAALAGSSGLVAAIGLGQRFFEFSLFPQGVAPSATFVNKNVAAGFVVLTWPLAGCLLFAWPRRPWKLVLGLLLGLQASYMLVARSRAVWLALAAQLLAAALFAARHRSRPVRLALVAAVVLAVGLGGSFGPRLPGALGEGARALAAARRALSNEITDDPRVVSARGRLAVWANTLAMVREHPVLGVGLRGHQRLYPLYAHAARPDPLFSSRHQLDFVHNDFLQITAEQGLVGLALWLSALAWAACRLWVRLSRGTPEERLVSAAAGLCLIGLCVDACFSFPVERALPPLVVAVVLAAALSPAAGRVRREGRIPGLLALALAAGLALFFGRRLGADWQVAASQQAQADGRWRDARRAAEAALRLDPACFRAAFALARLSLDQRQPAEALRWLDLALRAKPADVATLGTRAEAWGALGELERAIEDARRVAELVPREADAWYELGRWLERARRPAPAREAYSRAARLAPTRADIQTRLAVTAWRAGPRDEALEAARASVRLDPGSALAHKLLGLLLLEEPRRRDEGREHLRTALALDPQVSDAERLRALVDQASVAR